jgi:hypothetical protein
MARVKTCPSCKITKPVMEFGRNRQSIDGLHYYCRVCAAARQREWAKDNPEKVKTMRRNYLQAMHAKNEGVDPYE